MTMNATATAASALSDLRLDACRARDAARAALHSNATDAEWTALQAEADAASAQYLAALAAARAR